MPVLRFALLNYAGHASPIIFNRRLPTERHPYFEMVEAGGIEPPSLT